MKIPISKPCFDEEERKAILEPLESGWVVQGPKTAEFEKRFSEYTGSPNVVATSSCTTALHLALAALDIGPGDEVIVPAFTWVATANVVEMQGAKPVFADIELDTFNIDASKIEKLITSKTKAIMPVSLFGISAPMGTILEIAGKYGLKVIEDDACATGAWYHGHHAGTLANIGCFSFHPRKSITTGEGGMLITGSEEIAAKVRSLRDHGASKKDPSKQAGSYILPDFNIMGYNYRMTDLQGALGVAQMKKLKWILEQKTIKASIYDKALSKTGWLRTPVIPEGCVHGYQSYVTLFSPEEISLDNVETLSGKRNALMDKLEAAGIATRSGTHAVHMLGYYRDKYGIKPEDFPNAYFADKLSLAIPFYPQMTEEEQQYVIKEITEYKI